MLLSAVAGGRAKVVLEHPRVEIVLLTLASLPVTIVPRRAYAASVSAAKRRIGRRDPNDTEILALALHLQLPLWSNDRDFEDAGVPWYTTAQLLKLLTAPA